MQLCVSQPFGTYFACANGGGGSTCFLNAHGAKRMHGSVEFRKNRYSACDGCTRCFEGVALWDESTYEENEREREIGREDFVELYGRGVSI